MSVPRTLEELLADLRGKVIRLERRLNKGGGGGGGGGTTYVLPDRLGGPTANIPDLGPGVDLNTIKAPGWYIQNANVDATLALNYPMESRAGYLEVNAGDQGAGNDFTFQTYTEYAPLTGKPLRQWNRSQYGTTWYPWVQIDPGATGASTPLPAPIRYAPGTTHTVTATAWAPLANYAVQSITVSKPTWVLMTMGAWVQCSVGETRFGVVLGGATVIDPPNTQQGGLAGSGAWGQTGYLGALDAGSGSGSGQRDIQRVFLLNAGTTTFTIEAYMATAGTHAVNYPVLEVIPLYYDAVTAPVPTVLGATTKRSISASIAWATAATVVDWNQELITSGHFTWSSTTDSFTCVIGGEYRLTLGMGMTQAATAGWAKLSAKRNGTIVLEVVGDKSSVGGRTNSGSQVLRFEPGDTLTIAGESQAASGSLDSDTNRTWVELTAIVTTEATDVDESDTGWVDLSTYLVNGFTSSGNVEGRIKGGDVEIRGSMSTPTTSAGSSGIDWLANLPVQFRPTKRIGFGTGINNGYAVTVYVRTDGTGAVNLRDGLSGTTQFTIRYFLG